MINLSRRSTLVALLTAASTAPLLLHSRAVFAQTATDAATGDQAEYVRQTLMLGTAAMRASEVALEKAADPMVQEFAQLEVNEQQAIASVLSATQVEPPPLPEEEEQKLQRLRDMQAGADFDTAYVDDQIAGHEQLLEVQRRLSGETTATVEAITARLAEQAILSHLAMLNYIRQQVGRDPAATGAPSAPTEQQPAAEAPVEQPPAQ